MNSVPTWTDEFRARFASRLRPDSSGCLIWTGSLDYKGYGAISFNGKMLKAHRVAFCLEHGRWPSPSGLHACDTPACVRVGPEHVFEGTPADNTADMMKKGRYRLGARHRGQANKASKINPNTVQQIRQMRAGGLSLRAIAARVGISNGQVLNIVRGQHWGWV